MPHVVVKLKAGRSEEQKNRLTKEIVKDVMDILVCSEDAVSIAFEDINPEDWKAKVYDPEIRPNLDKLYKQPRYNPPA